MSKKKKKQKQPNTVKAYVKAIRDNFDVDFVAEDIIEGKLQVARLISEEYCTAEEEVTSVLSEALVEIRNSGVRPEIAWDSMIQLLVTYIMGRKKFHDNRKLQRDIDEACFERACLKVSGIKLH